MKATGIIKKIDNLGRIVIPKEMRKRLNLKKEEKMELYVDENKIILEKYDELYTLINVTKNYINIIDKIFEFNILVTNLKKIIGTTSNVSYYQNKEITTEYYNLINERKEMEKSNIYITKDKIINSYVYIKPIINNTELLGSIVFISNNKINLFEKKQIHFFIELIKSNLSDV